MEKGVDIVLMFDGIVEPVNPGGTGAWGFVLWIGTKIKFADSGSLGNPEWMTNNYAEYCALGFGLKKILELKPEKINSLTVLGDSMLVISQINGTWAMKSEKLAPLRNKCVEILNSLNLAWVARWIPRDINSEADEMSRKGYSAATGEKPPERHAK